MSFISSLRNDMLQTKQRRFQYQLGKIASIGTFFGASGVIVDKLNLPLLYYVIPFIAVTFDFFIISESFTLRRMAAFVRKRPIEVEKLEYFWEIFVKKNPDKFASFANFIFTIVSFIGSFLLLLFLSNTGWTWFHNVSNLVWLLFSFFGIAISKWIEIKLSKFKWDFEKGFSED